MGVKYFLVCVRKHKSNLPTNILTTVGMQPFWVKPHFCLSTEWCVFFYQSVYFFTNGVYHNFHHNSMLLLFLHHNFHHNSMLLWFLQNSVGKKIHTLPRYDLIFPITRSGEKIVIPVHGGLILGGLQHIWNSIKWEYIVFLLYNSEENTSALASLGA